MGLFADSSSSEASSSPPQLLSSASVESAMVESGDSTELFSFEDPITIHDRTPLSQEDYFNSFFDSNPDSFSHKFGPIEYAVFLSVFICSAGIGVFYGFCGSGQKSTEEYLMGSRKMSIIPVSLSLVCSFVSAITVLGNPIEIYYYGSTYGLILVSFIPMTLSLAYFYVPVYHNLQLSSAYEYLELRFSRYVRVAASLLGMIQYVFYMSIVVYGPALALSQVTGIHTRVTSSVIFSVCIFYSTLGGLKAVLWTDSLQAVIMIGSLLAIVTKGISDTGGFQVVWDIAMEGNRTMFLNFDVDPRTRHTIWTSIIGGYFMWLANFAATHSQVQRYLALSSLTKIRRALLLNLIGLVIIFSLCYLAGLALYARYYMCDPVQTKAVQRPDQLLPLFVMETLGSYQGFPGLFVAGITCASLSSVSSGLNSLAAILTYDYVKQWFPDLSDATLLRLSKLFCVMFGVLSFAFVFVAENLGNILPITFSIAGGVIGPILGVFSLGMFFPWANSKGALLGLLSAVGLMISLIVSRQLVTTANPKIHADQKLPGLSIEGCNRFDFFHHNSSFHLTSPDNLPQPSASGPSSTETLDMIGNQFSSNEILVYVTGISYMWYPALGCTLSVGLGLFFSLLLVRFDKSQGVNPDYLSPPALWLLTRLFPSGVTNWLAIDGYPMLTNGGCSFTLSGKVQKNINRAPCAIMMRKHEEEHMLRKF